MRLLYIEENNELSITEDLVGDDVVPPYAIVSHTWGEDEVTLEDIMTGKEKSKRGYQKLLLCTQQARRDKLRYIWMYNCCVDLHSSAGLSEAINSIFRWFQGAAKCYVYLSDVSKTDRTAVTAMHYQGHWESDFRASRWFKRSWTLPELLAPQSVEFFSRKWELLGDKSGLEKLLCEITQIPIQVLRGAHWDEFGIEECISWMKSREATRQEDRAYAILGIFGVSMPIFYGEGEYHAIVRLREEVARSAKAAAREQSLRTRDELRYSPLGISEFRILVLHPGIQDQNLSVDIETDDLSRPLPYQALSYVWGAEPALHPLYVNGDKQVSIRPNLFQALKRIRRPRSALRLWIDSICIDQSNTSERNLQVQRMGEIFHKARDVWIWLGEEYSNSDNAMDLISGISFSRFSWAKTPWNVHGMLAFNALLGRPWFQRGWVVQEAAFSANSIVVCGDRQINWRDLTIATAAVRKRLELESSESDESATELVPRLHLLLDHFRDSPATRLLEVVDSVFENQHNGRLLRKMTLERLVELGTSLDTTDPRDSIYALLNLASDTSSDSQQTSNAIIPNYDKDVLTVFADFVAHCCRTANSLDIICRPWAPIDTNQQYKSYTPSWIKTRDQLPFGNPSRKANYRLHGTSLVDNSQIRLYNAHNGTSPIMKILKFSRRNQEYPSLRVRGIIVATITRRSMRMTNALITSSCIDTLRMPSTLDPIPPHSSEILRRILCADRVSGADLENLWERMRFSTLSESWEADIEELLEENWFPELKTYLEAVRDIVWNRRTIRARRYVLGAPPLVGIAPQGTQTVDKICILYGCSVPVVLRKLEGFEDRDGHWQLIGEAYVEGLMNGEELSGMSPEMLKSVEIDFEIR